MNLSMDFVHMIYEMKSIILLKINGYSEKLYTHNIINYIYKLYAQT